MDNRQVAFALGLAQKAGKVAAGDFAVRSALNGGKAKLMLIAFCAAMRPKFFGVTSISTISSSS